ncbi:MAG: ROK family protein [Lachnospiraceae bacterium]|nr:ROK family protein [Lachnospiraceae bacterium]
MRIAALDIGGTSIKSAVWEDGVLEGVRETDTNAKQGGPYVMEAAMRILGAYLPFDAIGISTAGQVDSEHGTIYYANENIPHYTGMEVRRILEERFGVPVTVENDVNAAALGEGAFGAAVSCRDYLCLTYGTGVGGAIVWNHEIYTGSSWSAGSFGGILVHPAEQKPGVEFSGCYEHYASTTALVKQAAQLDPSLRNGRAVFEAMERDEVRALVDRWIDEILYGLTTLIHVFNPSDIVLGGGVMEQTYVIEEIQRRISERVSAGFRTVRIVKAALGNRAGLLGAVSQARERAAGGAGQNGG